MPHCACSPSDCADADRAADEQIDMLARRVAELEGRLGLRPNEPVRYGCPCRRENGGSGICGCVLGGLKVTC